MSSFDIKPLPPEDSTVQTDLPAVPEVPIESMAISQFKATCLAVIERVYQSGQPLLITKRGRPVAQILPPPAPETTGRSRHGCMAGDIEFLGDIVEPTSAEDWDVFK